jgi:hypothetical protein
MRTNILFRLIFNCPFLPYTQYLKIISATSYSCPYFVWWQCSLLEDTKVRSVISSASRHTDKEKNLLLPGHEEITSGESRTVSLTESGLVSRLQSSRVLHNVKTTPTVRSPIWTRIYNGVHALFCHWDSQSC